MSTVAEIEQAIERLTAEERAALRTWFANREATDWDRELEADVQAGRLDALGNQALNDFRQGRSTRL